jgi:zinc/manganese transport system substrate-binding protein
MLAILRSLARLALPVLVALVCAISFAARAEPAKIQIVAAESVYGGIARQIADDRANIVSILSNPNQDPHLFEVTPRVARALAGAQIVIMNGAGYDAWMDKLLKASPRASRSVIVVADLIGRKEGGNPHLWYDSATAPAVARAIAQALQAADPAHKPDYGARFDAFLASLAPVQRKVSEIAAKYAGAEVTATEPVFGPMASALNLKMRNEPFQIAIQNGVEPSARAVAAFEQDLRQGRVKVLFYNKQVASPQTARLLELARASHIPAVGIAETQPPGLSFQDWMLGQLNKTEKALAGPSS